MSWLRRRADPSSASDISNVGSTKRGRAFRLRCLSYALPLLLIAAAAFGGPRVWLCWQIYSARRDLAGGNPTAAVDRLTVAVAYAPNVAEAQYRLAVAHRRAGHLDSVLSPLKSAQALGWDKDDIERQTLLTVAQSGEIDSVHPRLKSIMTRGASDEAAEEIYEALAIGFLKTYRLKEAWDCLNYWGIWRPNAIFPKFWRADICQRIDNPTAEEKEYRDILAIDPHHVESRSRLAKVLRDSNRVEEAAREYELCLGQDAGRPDVLIGLAECRHRLGEVTEAVELLERAMAMPLSPAQRSAALTRSGQIEADAGRCQEAIPLLEEAVRLAPFEPATLFALSQAYSQAGDEQKSQAANERSKLVRAKQNRVDEIARGLVDHPGSADLRYEAGTILMDLGMKEDGAAWLRTALQMQPDHAAAREALKASPQ